MATTGGSRAKRPTPPFSPTIALLTVSRVAELQIARVLDPHGLTLRKYGALGHIAASPGLSMSELGRRSGITVQSVHTLIRSLADAGLVTSEVESAGHPARVSITPAGAELLDIIAVGVTELDTEMFGTDEMHGLSDALAAIVEKRTAARSGRADPQLN